LNEAIADNLVNSVIPGAFSGFVAAFGHLILIETIIFPLIIGLLIAILLYYTILKRIPAMQVFEHELTHALLAILFFRRIKRFVSTSSGGYVYYSEGFGGSVANVLITLAPYYLPTFTLIACLVRPFLSNAYFPWFDGFIGFTLGYHIVSTIDETIRNYTREAFFMVRTNELTRTDIGKTGLITSGFIIIALTLLLHGIAIYLIVGGYSSVGEFFSVIVKKTWAFCLLFYYQIFTPMIKLLGLIGD
jgi:hypothetical protein